MNRIIPLGFAFCLFTSALLAGEPIRPDSLLNWLRLIELKEYKLLHASDENSHYFAVKVDADGDVLFCNLEHDGDLGGKPRGYSLRIEDENGHDLHDNNSKKQSPETIVVEFPLKGGGGTSTFRYLRGRIYPLQEPRTRKIRVTYRTFRVAEKDEDVNDDMERLIFDRVIELPDN